MTRHYTVEQFESFDVQHLHRGKVLREPLISFPWCSFKWPYLARVTAHRWYVDIEFREGATQRIPLVWTRCHFGGERPWFMCGRCDARVAKLYNTGASLSCRHCNDLWYASQRRGAKSRRYLQALKLRLRLNGIASLAEPIPERPKRMHGRTYRRLAQRLANLEQQLRYSPRFMARETDYSILIPK
jgi:hypothetical protein